MVAGQDVETNTPLVLQRGLQRAAGVFDCVLIKAGRLCSMQRMIEWVEVLLAARGWTLHGLQVEKHDRRRTCLCMYVLDKTKGKEAGTSGHKSFADMANWLAVRGKPYGGLAHEVDVESG